MIESEHNKSGIKVISVELMNKALMGIYIYTDYIASKTEIVYRNGERELCVGLSFNTTVSSKYIDDVGISESYTDKIISIDEYNSNQQFIKGELRDTMGMEVEREAESLRIQLLNFDTINDNTSAELKELISLFAIEFSDYATIERLTNEDLVEVVTNPFVISKTKHNDYTFLSIDPVSTFTSDLNKIWYSSIISVKVRTADVDDFISMLSALMEKYIDNVRSGIDLFKETIYKFSYKRFDKLVSSLSEQNVRRRKFKKGRER